MLDELKETTDFLTAASEPLSLPMSFLLDPQNRVSVTYRGELDVGTLLEDASNPNRTWLERFSRIAPLGGRAIDHPHVRDAADTLEATILYRLGRRYEDAKNVKLARHYYQQAVNYWSDFPDAQRRLEALSNHP